MSRFARWTRMGCGLVVLAAFVYVGREHQALAAVVIDWSDFERRGEVYFAPTISEPERVHFHATFEQARGRLRALYGPLRGRPKLIIADAQTLSRFTSNSIAVTHYQPTGAVSVFGPAGETVDVVAHELAHAELFARLGYGTLNGCIPTWFDEGLAVQFDERPFYGKAVLADRLAAGWQPPSLAQLGRRSEFFAGSRDVVRLHYAVARAAVGHWLRTLSPAEAVRHIEVMDCGERTKHELERIASSMNQGVSWQK